MLEETQDSITQRKYLQNLRTLRSAIRVSKWHNGEWLALLFKNEILGSIQEITKERETHVNNLRSAKDVVIEGAEKAKFWAKLFISVFHP